jgi:hypothetical protein
MSIYMKGLLPKTYQGLEELSLTNDWADIQPYMEPELVAWLVYRLEIESDLPKYFPSGKWATIQRLQDLLREEALIVKGNK